MDRAEALKKAEAGEINAEILAALTGDDGSAARLAALEAKLEAESGKAGGILEAKKKAQAEAAALQAKIDELESRDLGEVEKLKLEMQRMQSKLEQAESAKAELEATFTAEKRANALNKVGSEFKWMDTVPKNMRDLIIKNEFDGLDLGNEVLVADKVKSIRETYASQLAADVPGGTGARAGDATGQSTNNAPILDKMAGMSDKEILANSAALLAAANEAG